ncbi:MAG: hypothetical protein HC882_04250 [Acidobacteria bacterium]|nr:hypothetical protein [Acidobacteriota bacterium]
MSLRSEVRGDRGVARLEVDELDRVITLALTRPDCPIVLLSGDAEGAAELAVETNVLRWRERRLPGGRPIFNRKTGRDEPGFEFEVEIRYSLTIRARGVEKPLFEKENRSTAKIGTMDILGFDPRREARQRAMRWIVDRVRDQACDQAKAALRGRARATEPVH